MHVEWIREFHTPGICMAYDNMQCLILKGIKEQIEYSLGLHFQIESLTLTLPPWDFKCSVFLHVTSSQPSDLSYFPRQGTKESRIVEHTHMPDELLPYFTADAAMVKHVAYIQTDHIMCCYPTYANRCSFWLTWSNKLCRCMIAKLHLSKAAPESNFWYW